MNERVKYYPPTDLFFGYNLSKIETIEVPAIESININDAIEFFQIKKYFDTETCAKTWSDAAYKTYKDKCSYLWSLTLHFFNQINDDSIINHYKNIEMGYHSDFWVLFDHCKLFNKINNDIFKTLIEEKKVSPRDLFSHNNIVRKYGTILKNYILKNEHCIIILIHVYEQDYTDSDKLFLPTELTGEDICNYIESYIDGEHPNANYLRTIINMHRTTQIPITDEIRLKAKRRYEKELKNILKKGTGLSHEIQISFNNDQEEEKIISYNNQEISLSYSTKWLLDTLDYPSILNNFIYLFDFVDVPQMRCSHVNKISQSTVFERVFASKSSRVYPHNFIFDISNEIAAMQMNAYYNFLSKHNIRLEDVIKWFFTEQIQSEFNFAEVRLSMPTPESTYAEKCYSIITAFESILKQFSLYVKNGEIDFELVEISTTPTLFKDIKSTITNKYIYGAGNNYKQLSFWLFSDQCIYSFVERIHKENRNYNCLIDLLSNETVYVSDYHEEALQAFEKMASYDLIIIDRDGKISLKSTTQLAIMKDLHKHNVISRWHYPSDTEDAFEEFIEKGIIQSKSTLFSQPEIDYLNYLLNRAEYSNGLEIRNKYIHGTQQVNLNEEEHKQNYFVFLRLFILLAIKINDDLCLKEQNEGNKKEEPK